MIPIHEVSAAPHFPQAYKSAQLTVTRPEAVISALMVAAEGSNDVEITEHDGEIYIAITATR
jgi:hypothetical protein